MWLKRLLTFALGRCYHLCQVCLVGDLMVLVEYSGIGVVREINIIIAGKKKQCELVPEHTKGFNVCAEGCHR